MIFGVVSALPLASSVRGGSAVKRKAPPLAARVARKLLMLRRLGQFDHGSIRFRWSRLVVAICGAMAVAMASVAAFVWSNQSEQADLALHLWQIGASIGVGLAGALLLLFFGLRFVDGIAKSIKDLAATSRRISDDKDYSRRIVSSAINARRDELGELVANFNALLAGIERREVDLSRCKESLDHAMLARAEDLSAAQRESQMAKAAAEAATMVKSRFLAAASHDLRQPMFAINLFTDALSKTPLNDEQRRIHSALSRAILSLGELLEALLEISKLDAGAIKPKEKPIDVHELFKSIDAEFGAVACAKGLRFKLQFPMDNVALFSDGQLLQSLLRNLIANSITYTERGGVLVGLRHRGDQAILQVWDTGIGIAPEHMDTIFEEYFQVANPERDSAKGLGLGLSIARRQAQLLRTEIACRSRLGKGSVFELRLPLADAPR